MMEGFLKMGVKISVLDYGMGNVFSLCHALKYLKSDVFLESDPKKIANADRLIIPGVGSLPSAMLELKKRNLLESILEFHQKGRPFLGICLGMQMLLEKSEEFMHAKGFNFISGLARTIPTRSTEKKSLRIPRTGWYPLYFVEKSKKTSLLRFNKEGDYVYFNHSYAVHTEEEYLAAVSPYGVHSIAALIQKENVYGCQFHPEKSGENGLCMLKAFLDL